MRNSSTRASSRFSVGSVAVAGLLLWATVFAGAAQGASTTVKKTFTSNTPVAIPDWTPHVDATTGFGSSYIDVSGVVGNITKVTASVHLTHGNIGDLDAAITGPDGSTYSYLFAAGGTSGTSLGTSCADADRATFDDYGGTPIENGTSPYVGSFRTQFIFGQMFPLSVFNANAAGSDGGWVFSAYDAVPGNTGAIECWSLFIDTDTDQHLRFDSNGPEVITEAVPESGGPGVANSPIIATGLNGLVSKMTVSVWVTHPQDSDLDVVLVGPTGKEVKLAARVGGTGNDFGTSCGKPTTFDDGGKSSISQGVAPYVGTFRPSEALTGFGGLGADGDWTLRVIDNHTTKVGTINCWSLSVTASTTTTQVGVLLTAGMTAPHPLPGTFDYAYFTIKNNTANPLLNVTLTSTLPSTLLDVREDNVSFPNCDVNVQKFTCTWAQIDPGQSFSGGAIARVGTSKQSKICFDGAVVATGKNSVKASSCFTMAAYPAGDRGTGYAIGDIAHQVTLPDQNGHTVSLSDFAGKYVLLQFTAAWCPPSNFEVPQDRDEIAALNDSNAMGVEVVYLTVMLDGPNPGVPSTQQNAVNWFNHFHLTTPVLWTANDVNKIAVQQHGAYDWVGAQYEPAIPTSVFIRPNGQIFDFRLGAEQAGGTTDRFLNDLP